MDRKEFFQKSVKIGICFCAASLLIPLDKSLNANLLSEDEKSILQIQKHFIENWLTDLLNTIDDVVDEETKIKLFEGCGKGCFNRHQFKKDIAITGKDDLDKLIEAYKKNFEIWREEDLVHIRYGEISSGCYCPVARDPNIKTYRLQCECTRTTHQTIFETALGRPHKVDIVETVRRGGKTCHFIVHLN